MIQRRLQAPLLQDLSKKMCWVAGPRQCGKTTLSEEILKKVPGQYYNWDNTSDQQLIRSEKLNPDSKLWVFDEIHKYKNWRNWLKGIYDKNKAEKKILVTGSARLDVFSRGGDSLQGRYFFHRMHPVTLTELLNKDPIENFEFQNHPGSQKALEALFHYSGFPEPLNSQNDKDANRWRLSYSRQLFRDDVRDLDLVRDLDGISLLFDRLPQTVSSPLSINSLREDLLKNFETVKNWIGILDNLYATFRLPPFGSPKIKAVKKEQKLYLWDWVRVEDKGARFENLIALHLLRFCHWTEDQEGEPCELRYVRDEYGKECDFIVLKSKKPLFLVECKSSDREISKNLRYFLERIPVQRAFQLSFDGKEDYETKLDRGKSIRVIPAHKFLSLIP